jgi:acylpyruvate hydrolase
VRLVTCRTANGRTRAGRVVEADSIVLLDASDVGGLLQHADWRARSGAPGPRVPYRPDELAPVVPAPRGIACVGLNYKTHIAETGRDAPLYPTIFAKWSSSLLGPRDAITLPAESKCVDWEAELVVVIGATIRRADRAEATAAIAGYTCGNDVTMRDWQRRTSEWFQGKTWEASTPLGPELVTPDELGGDPGAPDLAITCDLDGKEMQGGRTGDLLFDPATLVSYLSQITTLTPGDLVFTGTLGGVGAARQPPMFLTPGSLLVTSIEGIGSCVNRAKASHVR